MPYSPVTAAAAGIHGAITIEATVKTPLQREVQVLIRTDVGDLHARYHAARGVRRVQAGVLCVSGSGGGFDGPAMRLYPELCDRLASEQIAGLRIDYRRPNELGECTLDALAGVEFLKQEGIERIAIVGHSFGGAVAIMAGVASPHIRAVVAMSTQTYGTDLVSRISPRPLLLIHGTEDEILTDICSQLVYAEALEPKELELFKGARHGLDLVREDVLRLLENWIPPRLAATVRADDIG
jgi:hypothetical protein